MVLVILYQIVKILNENERSAIAISYINEKAKSFCDKLIVGVTTDELVSYKSKNFVIPFEERSEIVESIKYVDAVVPQENMNIP